MRELDQSSSTLKLGRMLKGCCKSSRRVATIAVDWKTGTMGTMDTNDDSSDQVLPPRKLTWNLKMTVSNRNLLFQGFIFRFHVGFPWCIRFFLVLSSKPWRTSPRFFLASQPKKSPHFFPQIFKLYICDPYHPWDDCMFAYVHLP